MADELLTRREAGIVTLTLNRPEKLNAMTKSLWLLLGETVRKLDGDETVRCIVLRGAGGKAFSPGNDISEFTTERSNADQARAYGKTMHGTLNALVACRHPLVGLIEGICVGGGLELAALCDLRICGEGSRFGAPINRLGLVMAYDELGALYKLVGRAVALEILLEGRIFGAAEAKEKGLVTRVVADDKVEEEAYATARRIADGAPLVARWHKKFVARLERPEPLTAAETDEGFLCFDTKDFQIGYKAFLEKVKPKFEGK
ncbi:MAG TPA: enoyl-CoA hydratase-related protein [Stellaceae bacterium]|jgi:enoyl-CoA hydratase/carnithine racemase|nr:enoyl-CoA hydratase-related protein [Stellaceae bacterium]